MGKKLCLLHANCQGEALQSLLMASPDFSKQYEIKYFVNYIKEKIPERDVDGCALFLYQHLGLEWGEIASEQLLKKLPSTAVPICVPNCFFKGYWPFWVNLPNVIDFADRVLEELLSRNLPPEAIIYMYDKADATLTGDIEQEVTLSLLKEREKELQTPIKYTHIIEEDWRTEQLFATANHPGQRLMVHIANEVLKLLELPGLSIQAIKAYQHPLADFWLPIHPVVGKRLGIPFADRERNYPCFGAEINHADFVRMYLACRYNGVANISAALRTRSDKIIQSRQQA